MKSIRTLVRLAAVAILAGSVSGCFAIYEVKSSVANVPGYGYVVHVQADIPHGAYSSNFSVYQYYYVFQTEEEARRFIEAVNESMYAEVAKTHEPRYRQYSPEYEQIGCYLGTIKPCALGSTPASTIDRVVPPVPTGPTPR